MLVFGCSYKSVFAVNYIEFFPTITTGGGVTFPSGFCKLSILKGFTAYRNTYPASTTPVLVYINPLVCSLATTNPTYTLPYIWIQTTINGTYWIKFTFTGADYSPTYTGDVYYMQVTKDATGWYAIPPPASHFDSISISTSTQSVTVTGYQNATTSNTYEKITIEQSGLIDGYTEELFTTTATTTGVFSYTVTYRVLATSTATTTTPISKSSNITATIYKYDNNYFSNPFTTIQDYRYKTLLDATSTAITSYSYTPDTIVDLFSYPEYECGITSITGCIKNAGIWLFYPTEDLLQSFYNLKSLIEVKPPVGYFTMIKNSIGGVNATSTKKYNITIPKSIKDYVFTPFDIAIGGILWYMFAFSFYKRLKYIAL